MSYHVTRLTLYALLSAVEMDLREAISAYLAKTKPIQQIFPKDFLEKVYSRIQKDLGDASHTIEVGEMVNYLDFNETFEILSSNKDCLSSDVAKAVKEHSQIFARLTPIRNRVMHGRPLDFDDLAIVLDASEALSRSGICNWRHLKSTFDDIRENPQSVLGIAIPFIKDEKISHNLPMPDFDETGFLGRKQYEDLLLTHLKGPFPVVTVVGEGGLGKTALALKVAYRLLDEPTPQYDAIVWTTAKAAVVTPREILKIKDAITTSLGIFNKIQAEIISTNSDDAITDILTYLKEFKILLIIDNLETIKDTSIDNFLSQLPSGSKVLITSRIGLGEYEIRVKLDPLQEVDSARLLRSLSKIRGVEQLATAKQEVLIQYSRRTKNNPGYIKWFVSAVQVGQRPEQVLENSSLFLDYCMSNVYEYLNPDARSLLVAFQSVPQAMSQAELSFVSDISVLELQVALLQLISTNMVKMTSAGSGVASETRYILAELTREYLSKHHPAGRIEYAKYKKAYAEIQNAQRFIQAESRQNPYSYYSITMRSAGEYLVAKYLLDALHQLQSKEVGKAFDLIDKARQFAPQYFEVHRVAAYANALAGNLSAAEECYEAAVGYQPESAPLRLWYGNFLVRYAHDYERATAQYDVAIKIDPDNPQVLLERARASMALSKYSESLQEIKHINAISRMPAQVRRKVYDLQMQVAGKFSSSKIRQKDYEGACVVLIEFDEILRNTPDEFIDQYSLSTIERVWINLTKCIAKTGDPDLKARITKVAESISARAAYLGLSLTVDGGGKYNTGVIARTFNSYGFIKIEDSDEELFFHSRAIKDDIRSGEELNGRSVVYEIGFNSEGPCAMNIHFVNSEDID